MKSGNGIIKANFHTHSKYCDGRGELREFAEAAVKKGFTRLGFSSHAPVPFETEWTMRPERLRDYLKEVRSLAAEFSGRLEILTGLEIDYIPDIGFPKGSWIEELGLDYFIGSVHFIAVTQNGWRLTADCARPKFDAGVAECFGSSVERAVKYYYALVAQMALALKPPVIGHIDVIMKNNICPAVFSEDEPWYRAAVMGALEAARSAGSAIEINTGGAIRNSKCPLYPSLWILREMRAMKIPAVLNSDAHGPEDIDGYFTEARQILREAGFKNTLAPGRAGTWDEVPV